MFGIGRGCGLQNRSRVAEVGAGGQYTLYTLYTLYPYTRHICVHVYLSLPLRLSLYTYHLFGVCMLYMCVHICSQSVGIKWM